jgi:hypothetical protein
MRWASATRVVTPMPSPGFVDASAVVQFDDPARACGYWDGVALVGFDKERRLGGGDRV